MIEPRLTEDRRKIPEVVLMCAGYEAGVAKAWMNDALHDLELERAENERLREVLEKIAMLADYSRDSYGIFCEWCAGRSNTLERVIHKDCPIYTAQAALEEPSP